MNDRASNIFGDKTTTFIGLAGGIAALLTQSGLFPTDSQANSILTLIAGAAAALAGGMGGTTSKVSPPKP